MALHSKNWSAFNEVAGKGVMSTFQQWPIFVPPYSFVFGFLCCSNCTLPVLTNLQMHT